MAIGRDASPLAVELRIPGGRPCLNDRVELHGRDGVEAGIDQAELVADFQRIGRNVAT
jgi:hypothetical protein